MKRVVLSLFAALALVHAAPAQADLIGERWKAMVPKPPMQVCSFPDSWKPGPGMAAGDMPIPAPDSAAFPSDNTFCDFYQTAEQAFLWVTSKNADGNYNLLGKNFYNIIHEGSDFTAVPNDNVKNNDLSALNLFKMRKNGSLSATGKTPEVGGTGQAGNDGVLISQDGSLVYYGIHANDVFVKLRQNEKNVAYYASTPNFPTTLDQARQIEKAAGTAFSDASSLAIEIKTSWVDAATLPVETRAASLTILAQVPDFKLVKPDTAGTIQLNWDGKTYVSKTLAMTGMHIAMSVAGHPEMIWATFEHILNTQDNDYAYNAADGSLATHTFDLNVKGLTFYKAGITPDAANQQIAKVTVNTDGSQKIVIAPFTVMLRGAPVIVQTAATVRYNPWGNIQPAKPVRAQDPQCNSDKYIDNRTVVGNNTCLVSLASSVRTSLPTGDLRSNYLQVGAVWTKGGVIPTFKNNAATFLGSTMLANSTMETYFQNPATSDRKQLQCFSCHSASIPKTGPVVGTDISHIYDGLTTVAP